MTLLPRGRSPFTINKVAVVGAGPSGLATAKYLLAEGAFQTIDIFEQQAEVGGAWNYTPFDPLRVPVPQTDPNGVPSTPLWLGNDAAPVFPTPMYDVLHTNISKDLMRFTDQAFSEDLILFPERPDVLAYLVRYAKDIRHLISFSTKVVDITQTTNDGHVGWELTAESTITNEKVVKKYDAVVLSNGHYLVPSIPPVQGITEFHAAYPAIISHSRTYRSPDKFSNKKVIVVGNSASGLDIGKQISKVCKRPLLNSVRHSSPILFGNGSKEEVPVIVEYLVQDRAVRFEDGRIEKDIDDILYCTGYLYSFPFLKSVEPPVITSGRRALGLWQHTFNTAHPTLAFTLITQKIIPWQTSEAQGAFIAKVWSNKLPLPSQNEMHAWEKARVKEAGDGTSFHVLGYPADADYIEAIHKWVMGVEPRGGKEPPLWDEKTRWVRSIHPEIKQKFDEGGMKARTMEELGFDFEKRDVTNTVETVAESGTSTKVIGQ